MKAVFQKEKNETIIKAVDEGLTLSLRLGEMILDYGDELRDTFLADAWQADETQVGFEGESEKAQLTLRFSLNPLMLDGVIENRSGKPLRLNRLSLSLPRVVLGEGGEGGYAFFKNGYQSWTATHAFFPHEKERVPNIAVSRIMQDNPANMPSGKVGEFTADGLAILGNNKKSAHLAIVQRTPVHHFGYIQARFHGGRDVAPNVKLIWDFGNQTIAPGDTLTLDAFRFSLKSSAYLAFREGLEQMTSPSFDKSRLRPSGWCSWYYYYTKISEREMVANIETAAEKKVDWSHFLLDDGYMTAVGDWLSLNERFQGGLKAIADKMKQSGFTPGIWLAPFYAHKKSRLFQEHADFFLKDDKGKPLWAGWNPLWGAFGGLYALDTTHEGFGDYLKTVVRTFVHDFGFRLLKLDFLFAASLPGRAQDSTLSTAERLQHGLRLIREAAGEGVTLLGCGCPIMPAVGYVDAMRIGCDVAPFWADKFRYHLTNDPHALSTKFAIRSILTRAAMHRKLWINDPDCLMVRETKTKLTDKERATLANAIAITGGMYLISDKLNALPDDAWRRIESAEEHTKACDEGEAFTLDLLEHQFPRYVYNTAGYLGIFNLEDAPIVMKLDRTRYGLEANVGMNAGFVDVETDERFVMEKGVLDLGELLPHSSRVLKQVD